MKLPGTALICSLVLSSVHPGQACQICVPFPRTTTADLLLESEVVVLAREDPEQAFRYHAIEVLKGDPCDEKIDLFLNSSTRRLLSVYPDRSAVLTRAAKDGEPSWRNVGIADPEFEPLVRQILESAADWKKDPAGRTAFFSKHLGDANSDLGKLALLEVGRSPYAEIRKLGGALSRDQIHAFLANFRYIEWHALYILLLAQSDDAEDHQFIMDSFHSARRFATTVQLSLIHISEPTRPAPLSRMPSSA